MTVATSTYQVCEIFTSIQGEGTRIGVPSTFVRFLRCNLKCAWCDTTYSWKEGEMVEGTEMSPERILEEVHANDVVFTGGEPMMQDLAPVLALVGDRHVTIETNGTIFKPYDRVDLWSISPKLGSSGHKPNKRAIGEFLTHYPHKLQLKFVVNGGEDLAVVKALLSEFPVVAERQVPVIIQPVGNSEQGTGDYLEGMRVMVEDHLLADPFWQAYQWRALPQFHRLLWGDKRGI
ncbi:7-carboxy-7-deazaguanine synthase [compost metagenome]